MNKVDNFLAHFGILGMKWGRRKGSSSKVSSKPKVKKVVEEDDAPPAKKTKTGPRDMSDQELKDAVARLTMEKQYRELTKPASSPGKDWLKEVVKSSGKTVATKYVTIYLEKSVEKAIAAAAKKAIK